VSEASDRVLSRADLLAVCDQWRSEGEKIVFTNGCFDILHIGHIRYLTQAKGLGTRLVVGVNSDASTRALKGSSRPIVAQDERAEMLASLRVVDAVSIFDESTPDQLIRVVKPHVHVKGGDYKPEDLPEAKTVHDLGGVVRVLDFVAGRSTSRLVELIRRGDREIS